MHACADREVDSRLQKAGTVYQMCRRKVFRSHNLRIATMQGMGIPITGGVSPSLWCGDLAYESMEFKEAEGIPDEVFKGYSRVHSAGQEKE